jgi:hypothetical protein
LNRIAPIDRGGGVPEQGRPPATPRRRKFSLFAARRCVESSDAKKFLLKNFPAAPIRHRVTASPAPHALARPPTVIHAAEPGGSVTMPVATTMVLRVGMRG